MVMIGLPGRRARTSDALVRAYRRSLGANIHDEHAIGRETNRACTKGSECPDEETGRDEQDN